MEQLSSENNSSIDMPRFDIYRNKKSDLDESILIDYSPEINSFTAHVYAIILTTVKNYSAKVFAQKKALSDNNSHFNPFKIIGDQKKGSLSFTRIFVKNPAEKKYQQKMREKYPDKKTNKKGVYFPPLLLTIGHFCEQYFYQADASKEQIKQMVHTRISEFEHMVENDIHQSLKSIGKVLYLKGHTALIKYHLTREFPEKLLKNLLSNRLLNTITQQKSFSTIHPVIAGNRKLHQEKLLFRKQADPQAIAHILIGNNILSPLSNQRFPLIVVGEDRVRKNMMLNILKNANAKFLIFDIKKQYGLIANQNPRIRGYLLGKNYFLNIISTEGERIKHQVYAYWFAQIIAQIANLRSDIAKMLETFLLGVYRDPSNYDEGELQFRKFANQELTSEVTKMSRTESSTISNVLYPLGTYDELAIFTKVGRSFSFDNLFDTKGSILQFSEDDEQLTKIAYLFTLLKLRSIKTTDPKIIILEGLDEIIDESKESWKKSTIKDLILGLTKEFFIIIGVRSPSKIGELFKYSQTKLINRLTLTDDQRLLEKEFNFTNADIVSLNRLTEQEFYFFLPELATHQKISITLEPDTASKIIVDNLESSSSQRLLRSDNYLKKEGIPPEIKKAIFSLIKLLRSKPNRILPEEGLEQLLDVRSENDFLRAKEIALQEALIKQIDHSPKDSGEIISMIKLLERGERYYQSYLQLKKEIPISRIPSLKVEIDFENTLFSLLEEAQAAIKIEDYTKALSLMIDISQKLLGVLPEEERFINGKDAANVLEFWSYLMALKEERNEVHVKRLIKKFSLLVTNVLKSIKHKVLAEEEEEKEKTRLQIKGKTKQKKKKNQKMKKEDNSDDDGFEFTKDIFREDYTDKGLEFELPIKTRGKTKTISKSTTNKTSGKPTTMNGSKFLAASDDLREAGLPHLDSKGEIYAPKQSSLSQSHPPLARKEDDLYDPFLPTDDKQSNNEMRMDQEKAKISALKKELMKNIAENLGLKEIKDEGFVWHCLATRYYAKLDDGHTISEIVTTIAQLSNDIKKNAIISDETITYLRKLIRSPNLMPDTLKENLSQYLSDFS